MTTEGSESIATNDSDPIHSFLSSSQVFNAIKQELPQFIDFVKKNVINFLDICFSEEMTNESSNAFMVLSNSPFSVLQQLLIDDLLFTKASKVLLKHPQSEFSVSRIASILNKVLDTVSRPSNACVSLFFQLLPFIENTGVLDLYISVTISTSTYTKFLEMLKNTSFSSLLFLEFDNNCSKIKIGNLCRILRYSCQNPIIGQSFQTIEFTDKLIPYTHVTQDDKNDPEERYMRNNLWQAITANTSKQTIRFMRKVVPLALAVLTNDPLENLACYHIFCIDFLTKVIDVDPIHTRDFKDRNLLSVLQDMMVRFGDSSNVQGSVFRFLRKSLKWRDYAIEVMEEMMDLIVTLCYMRGVRKCFR